jgi:hypothetical protein
LTLSQYSCILKIVKERELINMFEEEISSNIYLQERMEMFQEQYEEWLTIMEMVYTEVKLVEKKALK